MAIIMTSGPTRIPPLLGVAGVLLMLAAGCSPRPSHGEAQGTIEYPGPRYPSYLKPPSPIDEVLPHVRPLARNRTGFQGGGLGIAQPGEPGTLLPGPNPAAW